MRSLQSASVIAAALLGAVLVAAPTAEANWFGLHVGSDGIGLSVGVGDWGVYGPAWNSPSYSLDFGVALSGYGQWVWVDGLGNVWRPYVAASWQPFTHGQWVYTSAGWTWVAYEPWGYVPHHYGEWALTSAGWVWVPGYTYRPAHVVWVSWGTYVGWYPYAPRGWSHSCRGFCRADGYGHSWGKTWGYHRGFDHGYDRGYSDGWEDARYATYVDWQHMNRDDVSRYAVPRDRVERSVTRTSVYSLKTPPSAAEVGRRSGREVREVALSRREVKMGERTVTVARPEGVNRTIERHASRTVKTVLDAPAIREQRKTDSHARPGRTVERSAPSGEISQSRTQLRSSSRTSTTGAARESSASGKEAVSPSRSRSRTSTPSHNSTTARSSARSSTSSQPTKVDRSPRSSTSTSQSFRRQATPTASRSSVSSSSQSVRRQQASSSSRGSASATRSSSRQEATATSSRSRGSTSQPSVRRQATSSRSSSTAKASESTARRQTSASRSAASKTRSETEDGKKKSSAARPTPRPRR